MKKEPFFMTHRPLADMHGDGVRFDPAIKQALINERANGAASEQYPIVPS